MKKKKTKESFWIRNYSKANVSLRDLGITIPAERSLDLLGHNYNLTLQQIEESLQRGSLAAKGKVIRKVAGPAEKIPSRLIDWQGGFSIRPLTPIKDFQHPEYEELMVNGDEDKKLEELLKQEDEDEDDGFY